MSIEIKKISIIGSIDVLPSGHIQVRRDDQVLEGDEVLSTKPHRHVLAPGDDLTGQDPRVVAVAQAAWTPENVKGWTAEMLAALAEEQAKRQAAHAAALEAEQKRQQELAEAQAKTVADHARAKAAIESAAA